MATLTALGLMSGTSLDGVDVALIRTDGVDVNARGPSFYRPYNAAERELLGAALAAGAELRDRTARPGILSKAEALVTSAHGEAVEGYFRAHPLLRSHLHVVGFHGQTIVHRPHAGLSVQLGDGEALARRLGVPVAYDFRAADLAAGGQGAPLVPIYHRALVTAGAIPQPVAVLNIGGVANLTLIDDDADLVAFDTGPGNALLDDFMYARIGERQDRDGGAAACGRVHHGVLATVLADPYFARPPPKSLDRNAFAGLDLGPLSLADGAATLTALTVETVAMARDLLKRSPRQWIIAGGGARNRTLMASLAARLAPAPVLSADDVGWPADALEAQAFAYLAVRALKGLPITFPGTTGVRGPLCGGTISDL
jgi:anhydro-N-acetylmuramic acid kinase